MLNPVDLDSLEIRLIAVAPSTDDEAKQSSPSAKAVSPFGPAAPLGSGRDGLRQLLLFPELSQRRENALLGGFKTLLVIRIAGFLHGPC